MLDLGFNDITIRSCSMLDLNFHDIIVMYFGGPIGTGKTTSAHIAQELLCHVLESEVAGCKILSFGEAVRKEASEHYGFDIELTRTQEGKKTPLIPCDGLPLCDGPQGDYPATVRDALQKWGQYRRENNGSLYWVHRIVQSIYEEHFNYGTNVFIIDDVRYANEAMFLKNIATVFRSPTFIHDDGKQIQKAYVCGVKYTGVAPVPCNDLSMAPLNDRLGIANASKHISEWAISSSMFDSLFDLVCRPEYGNLPSYVALAVDKLINKYA